LKTNKGKSYYYFVKESVLWQVIIRLIVLLFLYSLVRLLFFFEVYGDTDKVAGSLFFYGLRFDLSALAYLNMPFFLMLLLPFNFIFSKIYQKVANIVFCVVNSIGFLFALIDIAYFPFSHKRTTFAIFDFLKETNNFGHLLPAFLKDYWYLFIIFAGIILFLIKICQWTTWKNVRRFRYTFWGTFLSIFVRIVFIFGIITACRGGLQLRPITALNAGKYASSEYIPLVLNTPFCMILSVNAPPLPEPHFFDKQAEMETYFSVHKQIDKNLYFSHLQIDNVFIIILEGISSEYSQFLSENSSKTAGFTPFLDNLAKKSVVFKGYSNGTQSIEALPAIIGGIPSLTEVPFLLSPYNSIKFAYPLHILQQKGITTAFFHGGMNGTMNFDVCAALMGMRRYYGIAEYPTPKKDFDGKWGIFDLPYLQYVADVLDTIRKPFFASVFTLSSHHPFTLPKDYIPLAPKTGTPMQKTVAYTDYALQKFFEKISTTDWYSKTLFIITADHTNFAGIYENVDEKLYNIPILFFHPKLDKPLKINTIMQQTDIVPSVFSCMGWQNEFDSFGNNVFDTSQTHFAVNYRSNYYHFIFNQLEVNFDGENTFYFSKDKDLDSTQFIYYQNFIKSYLQQYFSTLKR
jgi:phosphoglycerol transferase MdoB-like AlkP superfamily enzyme